MLRASVALILSPGLKWKEFEKKEKESVTRGL